MLLIQESLKLRYSRVLNQDSALGVFAWVS